MGKRPLRGQPWSCVLILEHFFLILVFRFKRCVEGETDLFGKGSTQRLETNNRIYKHYDYK